MALIATVVVFAGCKEDETTKPEPKDPGPKLEDIVPGTWTLTELAEKDGKETMNGSTVGTFSSVALNINGTVDFTQNPNEFSGMVNYDWETTYTMAGGSPDTETTEVSDSIYGVWSISNGKLSLVSDGETSTYDVVSKSSTRIELKRNVKEEESIFGIQYITTYTEYLTVEK